VTARVPIAHGPPQIPTVVVNPLPDRNTTYIVLNRPFAFMEWLKLVSIPEVGALGRQHTRARADRGRHDVSAVP
jgi:hypothetical protein